MKKKVLITGITGFAGSHLADYLVRQNQYSITGTYLSDYSLRNIEQVKDKIDLARIDLVDTEKTIALVKKAKPDLLFHLAAFSAVGDSYRKPAETITNNVTAEINVLEGVVHADLRDCRVLIVSSADVYGKVRSKDLPIDEDTPLMPTNTYAVSKIAQDFLALQYFITYNLAIIRARPFNHIGPRQEGGFVVADFAKKVAEIEKGSMEPVLPVGNLNTKRDFTDVRDMIVAYTLLINKGKPGEVYNIGFGISHRISDILERFITQAKVKIKIEVDAFLLRSEDVPDRVCDNTKFRKLTGWKPTIPIEQTLKDTLEYWRNIV